MARAAAKGLARALATIIVIPMLVSYWVRSRLLDRDRALQGSTQLLALVPGIGGQYLRRAFLTRTLRRCAVTSTVEFGTIFSHADAEIDERVYVGPHCNIGFAHVERDALLGAGVHVLSGPHTHGTTDVTRPIRDQAIHRQLVRIGEGAWVGSGAIVMADVGPGSVIGAGAVVTRPIPAGVVAAGIPARILRIREPGR